MRASWNWLVLSLAIVLCSSNTIGSRSFHENVWLLDRIWAGVIVAMSSKKSSRILAWKSFFSSSNIVSVSAFSTAVLSSISWFVLAGVVKHFSAMLSYSAHNCLLYSKCSWSIRSNNLFIRASDRLARDLMSSSQWSSNMPMRTTFCELYVMSLVSRWYFFSSRSYSLNEWFSLRNRSTSSSAFLVIRFVYLSKTLEWMTGPLHSFWISSRSLLRWFSTISGKMTGIRPFSRSFRVLGAFFTMQRNEIQIKLQRIL